MTKIKSILSITLLVAILAALGAAGTVCALWADWYVSAPVIVAIWAGLALLGVNVYERGR